MKNFGKKFISTQKKFFSNTKIILNSNSLFGEVKLAPADPILGLNKLFKEDQFKEKVNLGVGIKYF
jgi:hypothetical protein